MQAMGRPPPIPNRKPLAKNTGAQPNPQLAQLFQQAIGMHQQGQLAQAKAIYERILVVQPKHFDALHLLGVIAHHTKNHSLAIDLIGKAIQINPNVAAAYSNRGLALLEHKRLDEALASFEKAIALKPDFAEAFYNWGLVLQELKRPDEALESYDKAIVLKPNFAEAFNNRGALLKELKRLDEALASYDKAIDLKPNSADAFNNRGLLLKELKRRYEALESYDKAIALKSDFAEALNNRGALLKELKRLDEALASYDKAIALKPDYGFCFGEKLHTQMHMCNWDKLDLQLHQLLKSISDGLPVTTPFPVLALIDEPEVLLKAADIYVHAKHPARSTLTTLPKKAASEKIRIGYYSADFQNHATSYLIAELFEAHDRTQFEIFGFSFGPNQQDEMRQRVSAGVDKFFEVSGKSDRQIAELSRDLGIDIAVDLKGFTQDARPEIFAEICAPIQVNYLGYPGTLAAPYIDYIIADPVLIPVESQCFYTEKVVYLPDCYQVNDGKRRISDKIFSRQEFDLPENQFVFCCFNNNYKILPQTFDSWMRILQSVDGSVLWLLESNAFSAANLRKEAAARGVDQSRLVFAKSLNLDEHLARHRLADLFLDTLPCNAHTTTSDALWAGLPVLTQIGHSFAARVSASLLNAIGLPELITHDSEQYESMAILLAHDRSKLAAIRDKLEINRVNSTLFNAKLYAKKIENAYLQMLQTLHTGKRPEHIHVCKII